ncbi:MAG: 4-hydroxythreonine-4-phosphate dehydrogenase PdxA [Candidatus Accumulibacter sp.]|uniref:4-hydroxythreonine-4-phosphate dehydrogenase PdxA n=1 Tax=Accumulibacter sp. TaxID=2053492 RepID=UPI001A02DC2D|nr:4-hydroxythreonine-4-phosphate dehydrogenase PdxA [Accumulibacter sp.]MBE2258430.1 4-hydroxythreonine-4-phosphate dehydrogenase PdxA [Paracoccaceae bacterium]MCB1942502.1 4-hydroxythreonine-4-phosphate dehydrogenase PdxA [Accumulibacter sp.]MCP5247502.1 4-hydroxythreonine-4-phosphate dehydrogenase PdxA [Accumulibacter sp.]
MRGLPTIAVTSGEPAGVGPEICLRLGDRSLDGRFPARLLVLGDRFLLAERAAALQLPVLLRDWDPALVPQAGTLDVLHLPLGAISTPGLVDPANASYVLALLDRALAGCQRGEFAAMVTGPVHKGVINDAGIPFSGHTEYLAERTATPRVVMLLAGGGLRVALVTTHLPLRDVAAAVTAGAVEQTLRILHAEMGRKYGIVRPRILVAGLNPHAGEGGYLGREEIEVIGPVLERLRAEQGMVLLGPLPADTIFSPPVLARGDVVLAMYHDQGLTALKYASFGHGINVTLGLPIIRTSVDHGTALELAGRGQADPGSLLVAVEQAIAMAERTGGEP